MIKLQYILEGKEMKGEDPCWDDYEMVGTKKKNGKEVPNCVPKSEASDYDTDDPDNDMTPGEIWDDDDDGDEADGYDVFSEATGKGLTLRFHEPISEAEYQGRKVTLNKPVRSKDGPKKFHVYVKNDKGNVVKVNFGDPDMEIKADDPERRKSFRARHNCDNPGPKTKARYWSCKKW